MRPGRHVLSSRVVICLPASLLVFQVPAVISPWGRCRAWQNVMFLIGLVSRDQCHCICVRAATTRGQRGNPALGCARQSGGLSLPAQPHKHTRVWH
jgi:hypothetical protein